MSESETSEEEDYGPCCPFCGHDPFHRVDNGVGMEAVAVTCCELGDLYFRGARAAPEEVTLSWEEFTQIGQKLSERKSAPSTADQSEIRRDVVEECAATAEWMCKINFMDLGGQLHDKIGERIRALALKEK